MKEMRDVASASVFKCTVVSLLPYDLREEKPGQTPGYFFMPKSDGVKPTVLVVSEGTYGIYLDGDRGTLRARTPSYEVGRSVIEDYIGSQLATRDDAKPGLFVVPGALTVSQVEQQYEEELQEARISQNNWFSSLVKMADDTWNRYHQHGAITDLMRYACKALGLEKEKDWMNVSSRTEALTKCPACFQPLVNENQAICAACGCVTNEEAYNKLTFAGGTRKNLKDALAAAKT